MKQPFLFGYVTFPAVQPGLGRPAADLPVQLAAVNQAEARLSFLPFHTKNKCFRNSPFAVIASSIRKPQREYGAMSTHDSNYLIERLLDNTMTEKELDAFLAGLHETNARQVYSDVLEACFDKLVNEQKYPPEADELTDKPDKPPAPTR